MPRLLSSSLRVPAQSVTANIAFLRKVKPTVRAPPPVVVEEAHRNIPGYMKRTVSSSQTTAKCGEVLLPVTAADTANQPQRTPQARRRLHLHATEASKRRSDEAIARRAKVQRLKEAAEAKNMKKPSPRARVATEPSTAPEAAPTAKVWSTCLLCVRVQHLKARFK